MLKPSANPASAARRRGRDLFFGLTLCLEAGLAAGLGACGDDGGGTTEEPTCLEDITTDCEIGWPAATYDEFYDRVLSSTCAGSATGSACHYEAAPAGSLYLYDREMAYNALVNGHAGGGPTVIPGDPACSELVLRLESDDPAYKMPRGPGMLNERERCAVIQWIANGAKQTE